MNPVFVGIYLTCAVILLVTEIIGIRRKRSGDTITETWRWGDHHLSGYTQWGYRVVTAGTLAWLLLHLAGGNWT